MVNLVEMDTFTVADRGVSYLIEQVEEGGYFGQVVGLEGCMTEGLTVDETIHNLREALALYIEVADDEGLDVPAEIRGAFVAAGLSA